MRGGLGVLAVLSTVVTVLVLGGATAAASSPTVHSAIGLPLIGSSHSVGLTAGSGTATNATAANTSKTSDPDEKVCEKKEHHEGTPPREHEPKKCDVGNGDDKNKNGDKHGP